jgi:alcohol dehydrogenase (cytochrome c)
VQWEFWRDLPPDVRSYGLINRGVALFERLVVVGTLDAHLVALDAQTGRVRWDVEVAPYRQGYSITGAPLAIDGLILTGIAGGDYPTRGFIDAYDAVSGRRRWRFYTIPAPGEPGSDTWGGDSWKTGGAATWLTGSFDSGRNLVVWGVGNPAPDFSGDNRPGDNLYSNSAVALDAATGRLVWHFQFTPHDEHDRDSAQVPVLASLPGVGNTSDAVLWANRNGFFYVLDRENGAFRHGTPFVKQNWAKGLDRLGRPIRQPDAAPTEQGTLVFPHKEGAANWWSPTFSSQTGLLYVPVFDGSSLFFRGPQPKPVPGEQFLGGYFRWLVTDHRGNPLDGQSTAVLKAIAVDTGKVSWEYQLQSGSVRPNGSMSTAGQLVFATAGTRLVALDALSGKLLWQFDTSQQITAPPITYLVDGRQYVAIAAGSLLLGFSLQTD